LSLILIKNFHQPLHLAATAAAAASFCHNLSHTFLVAY
jgi:hypothetical protein